MNTSWKFLGLLAALFAGVLAGAPAHAIANGEAVPDGRYPFAVKITSLGIPTADGGTRDSSCSGGLVSPSWVLTAAHCFRDVENNRVSHTVAEKTIATVGRADVTGKGGATGDVVEVRQHGESDVALVRLEKPVTGITPLRLADKAPAEGQKARLVGYGLTRPDAEQTPNRMRTGRFEVISVDSTELGLSGIAPRNNTSPCERDSGGPYFTEGADGTATLIGVVSRGPTCPHTGTDIATRADAVAPWVLSIIGDDVAPPGRQAGSGGAASRTTEALDSTAEAAPPGTRAASLVAPIALAVIPAVAVGFVALLITSSRRRRRGGHRRRG